MGFREKDDTETRGRGETAGGGIVSLARADYRLRPFLTQFLLAPCILERTIFVDDKGKIGQEAAVLPVTLLQEWQLRARGFETMKCATKAVPSAGSSLHGAHHSRDLLNSQAIRHENLQTMPDEDDRVLAILAMGGNDVPPTLVRQAVDERWTADKAARLFQEHACGQGR